MLSTQNTVLGTERESLYSRVYRCWGLPSPFRSTACTALLIQREHTDYQHCRLIIRCTHGTQGVSFQRKQATCTLLSSYKILSKASPVTTSYYMPSAIRAALIDPMLASPVYEICSPHADLHAHELQAQHLIMMYSRQIGTRRKLTAIPILALR